MSIIQQVQEYLDKDMIISRATWLELVAYAARLEAARLSEAFTIATAEPQVNPSTLEARAEAAAPISEDSGKDACCGVPDACAIGHGDCPHGSKPPAAPSVTEGDALPPLPQPVSEVDAWVSRDYDRKTSSETLEANAEYFTADQMRAYAQATIAADRAARTSASVGSIGRDALPPKDCSGDPTSCPDNEGYGCYCTSVTPDTTTVRSTIYNCDCGLIYRKGNTCTKCCVTFPCDVSARTQPAAVEPASGAMTERAKIAVDAEALREILIALTGPPYMIRELQHTRGPLFDSPIDRLVAEFKAQTGDHPK